MPLIVGLHFATSNIAGRRPWRTAAIGALGIAGLMGAAISGYALNTIVDTPARWGVNFDSMFGNPYAAAPSDLVSPLLDVDDVSAVTGANIGSVTIDGSDTTTIAFATAKGDLVPTVLEGRVPRADDEVGIGAEVARRIGADIGDHVDVTGVTGDSVTMLVVGIVVLPDTAGDGAAMTFGAYVRINPTATQNVVFVRFRPGAPASAVDAAAAAAYSPPDSLSTPVSIRALERVTAAPFLLCGVFALMLLVSGAYVLASSVRARKPDRDPSGAGGEWSPAPSRGPLAGGTRHRSDGRGRCAVGYRRRAVRGPLVDIDPRHRADHRRAGVARRRRRSGATGGGRHPHDRPGASCHPSERQPPAPTPLSRRIATERLKPAFQAGHAVPTTVTRSLRNPGSGEVWLFKRPLRRAMESSPDEPEAERAQQGRRRRWRWSVGAALCSVLGWAPGGGSRGCLSIDPRSRPANGSGLMSRRIRARSTGTASPATST